MYIKTDNNCDKMEVTIDNGVLGDPCLDIKIGNVYISIDEEDVYMNQTEMGRIVDWIQAQLMNIDLKENREE